MIENRFYQDRFNRQQEERQAEESKTIFSLEEAVGEKPRTEWGVGDYEKIKAVGREYESEFAADSPFVMLRFVDNSNKRYGFAKIYVPGEHEEISSTLLEYVNDVSSGLIECMKRQNPGCSLKGSMSIHGSDDKVILRMMKKYVKAELVSYKS